MFWLKFILAGAKSEILYFRKHEIIAQLYGECNVSDLPNLI